MKLSVVPPFNKKRGLPLVEPPEPTSRFGQTRTVALAVPVQLAEKVAVEVNGVLAARLMLPKLRFEMLKLQLCARAAWLEIVPASGDAP